MKEILLISRAIHGDRKALEQLIRLYYEKIYDYIAFRVHNQTIAEDLTQDVFLKLVKNIQSYVPTASFSAFLYRIARNTVIDYTRTAKQTAEIPEDTASTDQYAAVDTRLTVQSLLAQLPEEQRECVILYYIKGLKYREISQVLDIPIPTAKSRVQRGLAACKKRMEEAE
jgi:RNA polymerase sigma-70 factor (ECF subfamily)